jgi:hypothetical protein
MFNLRKDLPINSPESIKEKYYLDFYKQVINLSKFKCIKVASTVLYCVTDKPKLNNIFQY